MIEVSGWPDDDRQCVVDSGEAGVGLDIDRDAALAAELAYAGL
jgi:hypothetical protein